MRKSAAVRGKIGERRSLPDHPIERPTRDPFTSAREQAGTLERYLRSGSAVQATHVFG